jgi:hypothetical protein
VENRAETTAIDTAMACGQDHRQPKHASVGKRESFGCAGGLGRRGSVKFSRFMFRAPPAQPNVRKKNPQTSYSSSAMLKA